MTQGSLTPPVWSPSSPFFLVFKMLQSPKDKRWIRLSTNHPSQNQEWTSLKIAAEPRSAQSCNIEPRRRPQHPKTTLSPHVMHHFLQVRESLIGKGRSKSVTLQSVAMLEIHCENLEKQKHKRRKSRASRSLCVCQENMSYHHV